MVTVDQIDGRWSNWSLWIHQQSDGNQIARILGSCKEYFISFIILLEIEWDFSNHIFLIFAIFNYDVIFKFVIRITQNTVESILNPFKTVLFIYHLKFLKTRASIRFGCERVRESSHMTSTISPHPLSSCRQSPRHGILQFSLFTCWWRLFFSLINYLSVMMLPNIFGEEICVYR